MKYSIKYYNGCNILRKVNEVILKYEEIHKALPQYLEDNYDIGQRIVLDICGYENSNIIEDNISIWASAKEKHPNLAIKLNMEQIEIVDTLKENNIDFFLNTFINSLDKLYMAIDLGVKDVYICDELGFSLKNIGVYCHNLGINVRIYPNVCQSSCSLYKDTLKSFFIRPNDISFYEDYVDICEFYTDDLKRQDVLYQIYKDQKWLGDLSVLILGLKENIINTTILPDFGQNRLNCNKICTFNNCHLCDRVKDFSDIAKRLLDENGKEISIDKE